MTLKALVMGSVTAVLAAIGLSVAVRAQTLPPSGLGAFAVGVEGEMWQQLPPWGVLDAVCSIVFTPPPYNIPYASCPNQLVAPGQLLPLGEMLYPIDIANDTGKILVTDQGNNRVQAFDFAGTPIPFAHPIGNGVASEGLDPLTGAEQLNQPEGIAVDGAHHIVVGDSFNGRVAVFNTDGTLAFALPLPVLLPPAVAVASGIAVTPGAILTGNQTRAQDPTNTGRLVVTDKYNSLVHIYDSDFYPIKTLGTGLATPADGDFSSPTGAAIDSAGHIYIADYDYSRISIFDRDGIFLGKFGQPPAVGPLPPGTLQSPYSVTIDHRGRVIVGDTDNQRMAFFQLTFAPLAAPTAQFQFSINAGGTLNGYPRGVVEDTSVDPAGRLLTVDTANHRVQRFQIPDLAIVQVSVNPSTNSGTFGVAVPVDKDPAGVINVVPSITGSQATILAGPTPQAPAPATLPTPLIYPGQFATYAFAYTPTGTPIGFTISAKGNNNLTSSNQLVVKPTLPCTGCSSTLKVTSPAGPPPASGWYTTPVTVLLSATSSIGLTRIAYMFTSGPEQNLQPGVRAIPGNNALTASGTVTFSLEKRSTLEYWAVNSDGTEEIPHHTFSPGIDLSAPNVTFNFGNAVPLSNAAGWWNTTPVSVPFGYTDDVSGATLQAGSLTSPLQFTAQGANQSLSVSVIDGAGHKLTAASNDGLYNGQPVNIDTTAPTLTLPANVTIEQTSAAGATLAAGQFQATAADALSGVKSLSNPSTGAAGLVFAPGITTWTFIATDKADNQTTGTGTVTVRDTQAPVLTCAAAQTINADPLTGHAPLPDVTSTTTWTDASGHVLLTQVPPAGTVRGIGATSVTISGADPSNNIGTCTTSVTVKDVTPPIFTSLPPPQTVEGGAPINLVATATDNSGAPVTVVNNAPVKFPVGATPVRFTATDAAGNASMATVIITVIDTTPPTIVACAAPRTLLVGGSTAQVAVPDLTTSLQATDYSAITVAQSPAAGTLVGVGVTGVTLTARDPGGLSAQCTSNVTVAVVTAPPTITAVPNPGVLWPPNHRLRTINMTVIASDASGQTPVVQLVSITSSEPDTGVAGAGDTAGDIQGAAYGTNDTVFQLRAERSGRGPGRTYTITYSATGPTGIVATAVAYVLVPHDQSDGHDNCHGESDHGHHEGDGCEPGHHGHFDGDNCHGLHGESHDDAHDSGHGSKDRGSKDNDDRHSRNGEHESRDDDYHHTGDGCIVGHHGHYEGDGCAQGVHDGWRR